MKHMSFIVLPAILFCSTAINAKQCRVNNAKITQIHQYTDKTIFVDFNKSSDCACEFTNRMGFSPVDNEFFISSALTALTAGKSVHMVAEDGGCTIHGNTAKMIAFHILANG